MYRTGLQGFILILSVLLITLFACSPGQIGKKDSMQLKGSVPEIDVALPERIETATFALG